MPTLHETLESMTESLLHQSDDAEKFVNNGPFTAQQYIQLHRNNIFVSLTEALLAIYPVASKLVGEDFFRTACRHFIPDHLPTAAPLHEFGNTFPEFLKNYRPADSLPYLADVAQLEWYWHESFHAAAAEAFNASILSEIPLQDHGRLRFRLHPAVRLFHSRYPVYRIWQTNQEGYDGDDSIELDQGKSHVLIVRPKLSVLVQTISRSEWEFTSALQSGHCLDGAYELASRVDPEFDLAAVLQNLVADHTLVHAEI